MSRDDLKLPLERSEHSVIQAGFQVISDSASTTVDDFGKIRKDFEHSQWLMLGKFEMRTELESRQIVALCCEG